ncbi:Lrp/AsnC family transcriptional regulator [Nocardia xishanensis]|uniref:Lrp/AsnC family transcriptional regulator n=1 Tax=Nocardia xishanensis TaxID=238964 RepID=UPI00083551C4|nr:AsnC family transcriptional regulator [Nocardia xishanensis]
MESETFDAVDLGLLHALQVDGRAPFSRIARVLSVSDRTVARRFARLAATGAVRVTGVTDSGRIGGAEWVVRLRIRPHRADELARALAARPDTAWVTVLSSGAEIVCVFRTAAAESAPLSALARHSDILGVDAQRMVRHLTRRRWRGRTSALDDDQVAALRPAQPVATVPVALGDLDRRMLPRLAADGRIGYPNLAGALGWSESAVRRRLDELRRAGVLGFDVEVDAALLGYSFQCVLWLTVAPQHLAAVGAALIEDPEIAFAGAITGPHNIIAVAVCRDADAVFDYVVDRVGALPGVTRLDTAAVTRYAKRAAPALIPR